jgi:sulfatase modifying factor 1
VESVSWDDCRDFINKLNGLKSGLHLRLPTEAEWEYACRAGTQTPFWFGENITPDQVNYDGNHPYAGGTKGKYREETVAVKSLPCNGWGLYQMHGNVWEWCADRYGKYPTGSVMNPGGPTDGAYRVGRGGGWISSGRSVRSADRGGVEPASRFRSTGFRLAQGQSKAG